MASVSVAGAGWTDNGVISPSSPPPLLQLTTSNERPISMQRRIKTVRFRWLDYSDEKKAIIGITYHEVFQKKEKELRFQ
jgi:hypothetical protein